MPIYPVRVPRDGYRGANPARRRKQDEFNRMARQLEEYLNTKMKDLPSGEIVVFSYGLIAAELRLPPDAVRDVLYGVDAGSGGITIRKP